ncbi:hypothetical protein FX988_03133 [Paraglaciecola mesophila]|uniref:Uncharacterized protein n=1 Tax=Paraglaciecola mesophila TaxID=197222 RepID=A0A857JLC8_9ALTE|nr:hypothetical protein [Paraglaciecola mesophila]QHJ12875.1 hypothetical protein FX988_03133 [Paraglaciecola mesophila]
MKKTLRIIEPMVTAIDGINLPIILLKGNGCPLGNPHIQFMGLLRDDACVAKENDHGATSTRISTKLAQFM